MSKTLKLVYSALFAALVFAGTQFIRVPLPFGYFNLGDCFIILSAFIIGGSHAVVSSAIGAALADLLSGYTLYAPATLIIKSLMVITVLFTAKLGNNKNEKAKTRFFILGAVIAEIVMVLGYFLYDAAIYGFVGAFASVTGNIMQGIAAVISGVFIIKFLEHSGVIKYIKPKS